MTHSEPHRFLLVQTELEGPQGQIQQRFVEQHLFRLWQYVMANRHALTVRSATLCLWLPQAQWQRNADYFDRAGHGEAVDLLSIELFDTEHHLWERVQRFVPAGEAEACAERLLQRVPKRLQHDVQHRISPGIAVSQGGQANLTTLGHCFEDEVDVDLITVDLAKV